MSRFSQQENIFNNALHKVYNSYLLESQHIIETFDQCANSLINHINEYSEKYKYTGWNFISDSKLCIELNDRTIKYPIYLRIIKDPMNDNLYSIKDRTL